jgi:hypothetical protein
MRNIRELLSLGRDFARYCVGKDYFHQLQPLGPYFRDDRCYYNDVTHKADWTGPRVDDVPVLRTVASRTNFIFPITIFLYGIGSIDKYFLESDRKYLDQSRRVGAWMVHNSLPDGSFDNHWNILDPKIDYYSNNSAMCQGLALSFATRAVHYSLVDSAIHQQLEDMLEPIAANMRTPVAQGGTALYTKDGPVLLEFCRIEPAVVLNGWIFAIFGLIDYLRWRDDASAKAFLDETLTTMTAVLSRYCLPSGWSYYNDQGRISSPFYHPLHIAQLDALYRLTGRTVFYEYMKTFKRSNHALNRFRYTLVKIKDKLTDKTECSG